MVTCGICEFGLSRMIDIHHEFSAVRSLTEGMLGSMLRAIGTDAARVDTIVADAMQRCYPAP